MDDEKCDFELKRKKQTARIGGMVIDVDRLISDENLFADHIMTAGNFLNFRSHNRGWKLSNGEDIGPKQLIDLAETCRGDYSMMMSCEPMWSDHILRVQNADVSRPILMTEDGSVIDGAHRIARMFIEHIAHIPAKIVDHEKLDAYRTVEPKEHDIEKEKSKVCIATVADASSIARIQNDSWLATYPNVSMGITREDLMGYLGNIDARAFRWEGRIEKSDPNVRISVLRNGDRIIGFCSVTKMSNVGHIDALYLDPEFSGKGMGGEVLQEGLRWLGNERPVELEVASYNARAIRFYEHFGFYKQGAAKSVDLRNGKEIPLILMVRDVLEV